MAWNLPVMALYGLFFALGWWLHGQRERLETWARLGKWFLILGLVLSLPASLGVALHYSPAPWVKEHAMALKWANSFGTSLVMALSVLGWLGCFLRWFQQPTPWLRYLADASYWIYLVHLPLVVALQISLAKWIVPWWAQLPLLNLVAFAILVASYHAGVRFTWVGAWLNGRRYESDQGTLERVAVQTP